MGEHDDLEEIDSIVRERWERWDAIFARLELCHLLFPPDYHEVETLIFALLCVEAGVASPEQEFLLDNWRMDLGL